MKEVRPDMYYETHSLNELLPSEPEKLEPMLRDLARHVEAKHAKPLPMKVFEMRGELVEAFRCLQGGKNIGKVVVRVEPTPSKSALWDGDGAVLVTGGLGGLGIVTAETFVELGARCVVLASRSGKIKYDGQGLEARLEALRATGVAVVLERCDTGDESQVAEMLVRVRNAHGPLRAVVHAAGVLSDSMLSKQDEESMSRVFAPKAEGAWFLHKHTQADKLDVFLMFSSVASLFGNIGQANYSAANAYMDELARWRVGHGLAGLSVQWPAVSGVGMAAAMDERVKVDKSLSVGVATVKQVLKQLVAATGLSEPVQAVLPRGMLVEGAMPASVAPLTSSVKVRIDRPRIAAPSAARGHRPTTGMGGATRARDTSGGGRFMGMSREVARATVFAEVLGTVGELLGLEDEKGVDPEASLMESGLDSLAGTQLVRELGEKLGVSLAPTALFDYPSVNALADHLTDLAAPNSGLQSDSGGSMSTPAAGPAIAFTSTAAETSALPGGGSGSVFDEGAFDEFDDDDDLGGGSAAAVAAAAERQMAPLPGISGSVWSALSPQLRERLVSAVSAVSPGDETGTSDPSARRYQSMRKVTEDFEDEDDEDEVGGSSPSGARSAVEAAKSGSMPRSPTRAPVNRFGREPSAPCVYSTASSMQQAAGLLLAGGVLSLGASPGVRIAFGATFSGNRPLGSASLGLAVALLGLPLGLLVSGVGMALAALAFKWLVVGQQVPSALPMASHAYVRWWTMTLVVETAQTFVLAPLKGTTAMVWWLRALGATVGENVVVDSVSISDADLLVIGDGTVIQRDAVVRCSRVVPMEAQLQLQALVLGRHVAVGPLAHVVAPLPSGKAGGAASSSPPPTSLGRASLGTAAVVRDGTRLAAMASTDRADGGSTDVMQGTFTPLLSKREQCQGLAAVLLLHTLSLVPSQLLTRAAVGAALEQGGQVGPMLGAAASVALALTLLPGLMYCVLLVLVKRLVVGSFLDGENQDTDTPSAGAGMLGQKLGRRLRYWAWSRLLASPLYLGTLMPFAFTPAVPWFFRLLGATVGQGVWMVPPNSLAEFDLLEISDGCFSGGDYSLFPTSQDGVSRRLTWAKESGVTDRAVCLSGASLGERSVVGDMTTVGAPVPANSITVGAPLMRFPLPNLDAGARPQTAQGVLGRLQATAVVFGSLVAPLVLLPGLLMPGLLLLMPGMLFLHSVSHSTAEAAACAPPTLADVSHFTIALVLAAAYLVLGLGAVWLATALKHVALGTMVEGRHPFGSVYMLKWSAFNFSIVPAVHRYFTKHLRGSTLFNAFLRLNGAKVGQQVYYMGVLEASADFDLLQLGDRACVEADVRLQAHEVIGGHLAHRPIMVGAAAHIGSRSNLLAGATMQASSRLTDQSLLLGRSEAKPGQIWDGLPATLVRQPSALRAPRL